MTHYVNNRFMDLIGTFVIAVKWPQTKLHEMEYTNCVFGFFFFKLFNYSELLIVSSYVDT